MIKIQLNIKKAMIRIKLVIRMHAISTVVIITVKYVIRRKITEVLNMHIYICSSFITCILHTGMHIRTTVRDGQGFQVPLRL